jgi:hypothetical protein
LDNVFRIDSVGNLRGESAACQGNQAACIAVKQLTGRLLIAGTAPGHENGGTFVHRQISSLWSPFMEYYHLGNPVPPFSQAVQRQPFSEIGASLTGHLKRHFPAVR